MANLAVRRNSRQIPESAGSKRSAPSGHWLDGFVLAAIVVTCAMLVGRLADPFGLPLDDAWIHQVIARNFAEHGTLGFDPERFGSGATSWTWPLILSLFYLSGGESPAPYSFAVNTILHVLSSLIVWQMLLQSGRGRIDSLLFAMAFSVAANYVWFVFSGMESTLVVFLACAAIYAWHCIKGVTGATISGLACVSLIFTRTETALLPALIAAQALAQDRAVSKRLVVFCAIVASGTGALLLLNKTLAGSYLPSTLEGRRWMWLLPLQGATPVELAVRLAMRWVDRLGHYTLGIDSIWPTWTAMGLAAFGAHTLWAMRIPSIRLLIAFAAMHIAIYAVLLPVEGHGGRYQPLVPALFALALFVGASTVARSLAFRFSESAAIATNVGRLGGLVILTILIHTNHLWGYWHAAAVEHINLSEVRMARRVAALPVESKVASFDIGAMAFFSRRPLIDLGALSDPSILASIRAGETVQVLVATGAAYVVVPQWYRTDVPDPSNYLMILGLDKLPPTQLVLVAADTTPSDTWLPGLNATMHSAPSQALYRFSVP